jgi:hypothetical protein
VSIRDLFGWGRKKALEPGLLLRGAARSFDESFDQVWSTIKRYKAEMAQRPTRPSGNVDFPTRGTMGDSDAGRALHGKALKRIKEKVVQAFDFSSHHIVLAYLRRVASGGARDRNFEARSLQESLQITAEQVSAILHGYARERGVPTAKVFRFLLPPTQCDDDALASHFMKIMVAAEIGNFPEDFYFSALFNGLLSETDDVDLLFLGLLPRADNVGFVVDLCRSLDRLRSSS